jgi:hypothetical protein
MFSPEIETNERSDKRDTSSYPTTSKRRSKEGSPLPTTDVTEKEIRKRKGILGGV